MGRKIDIRNPWVQQFASSRLKALISIFLLFKKNLVYIKKAHIIYNLYFYVKKLCLFGGNEKKARWGKKTSIKFSKDFCAIAGNFYFIFVEFLCWAWKKIDFKNRVHVCVRLHNQHLTTIIICHHEKFIFSHHHPNFSLFNSSPKKICWFSCCAHTNTVTTFFSRRLFSTNFFSGFLLFF